MPDFDLGHYCVPAKGWTGI